MSGHFLQRSLFAAGDGILGCDCHITHTEINVTNQNQPNYGQTIDCGLTTLTVSLFSLCRLRIATQLRSGAVDKMANIFTKCIWQLCICQPNELKRGIKKKLGGPNGGAE